MEKNSKKNFEISKTWNRLLEKSKKTSNDEYINLDNYAFRMDVLINHNMPSDKNTESLVRKLNEYIEKKSNLSVYLAKEREKFNKIVHKKTGNTLIEILDVSNTSLVLKDNAAKGSTLIDASKELQQEPQEISVVKTVTDVKPIEVSTSMSESELRNILHTFKNHLEQENLSELKSLITHVSQKHCIEDISKICKCLIESSLSENQLNSIVEGLCELNSVSSSVLSYNVSYAFLGILSAYVKLNLIKEGGQILSRQIFAICSNACNKFTRQFILSCLSNWISLLNENLNDTQKLHNKLLTEFLVKLIKDCFDETSSIILLQHLTSEFMNTNWSENVYNIVSSINEKIVNFKFEYFKAVIDKMQGDMKEMCKSNVFSKLLLSMMNKFKQVLANQPQNSLRNSSNLDNTEMQMDIGNNAAMPNTEFYSANQNKKSSLTHMIDQILLIIECNQTILKRSLLNIANSFKGELLI